MNLHAMRMGHGLDPRPEPAPPPRPIPPDIDLGLAPKLLFGLGAGLTASVPLFAALAWGIPEGRPWMIGLAALHGVAGIVLLVFALRVRAQRRVLAQHGLAACAHVFRVSDHISGDGAHANPHYKDVSYRYVVAQAEHVGAFTVPAPGPAVGTPLWVIYDPARPRRHLRFR